MKARDVITDTVDEAINDGPYMASKVGGVVVFLAMGCAMAVGELIGDRRITIVAVLTAAVAVSVWYYRRWKAVRQRVELTGTPLIDRDPY